MAGALDGYRVLDLSTGAAGALAGMLLSDHGAEVLRVIDKEAPALREGGFVIWDRGKACTRLDFDAVGAGSGHDQPANRAFADLVKGADILLEDFAPASRRQGMVARDWLRSLNRSLVDCSITAYGKSGPWKDEPPVDDLVLARTGVLGGLPGFRPAPVHLVHPLPSVAAAVLAVLGLSAALYAREFDGHPRSVETSLMSGALLFHPKVVSDHVPPVVFQTHPSGSAPFYSVYECADGQWVQLGCVSQKFIDLAGEVMGITDTLAQDRFGGGRDPKTLEAEAELRGVLSEVVGTRKFADWARAFEAADVPFAEARWTEDSLDDPQVQHNEMCLELEDPVLGPVRQMGVALKLTQTAGRVQGPRQDAAPLNSVLADWRLPRESSLPVPTGEGSRLPPSLDGVRILEITNLIAGPTTGRLLAELGADVIKLEPPGGDMSRPIGRTYFYSVNFNKRSVCVNTSSEQGKRVVQNIAASADALVANLRPAATERMGIVPERCPNLVETHLTGYGWSGPYSKRPGIDPLAQAMMGLERAQGGKHNSPVFPAQLAPTDFTTGAVGALGAVLGLLVRKRTGVVQRAESNLLNGGILLTSEWFSAYAKRGERPLADRDQYGLHPFHRLYQVRDGWIYVAADEAAQRRAMCDALGLSSVGDGSVSDDEHPNETAQAREFAEQIAVYSRADCLARLNEAGVPAAPAEKGDNEIFLYDPHAIEGQMVVERRHPKAGKLRVVWRYVSCAGGQDSAGLPTPLLGEHTAQVLDEVGMNQDEVRQLFDEGILITESA